jgi:predicted nucleic acid-binding protein
LRRAVIADTGPLYAAVDPHDGYHRRALEQLEKLAREKREVIVPFPILLEAYSLVFAKLGGKAADKWLMETAKAILLNPAPEDYRQAISKVRSFSDQSISLFDASIAALATRLALEVWTYDHHFDVMRIPVWR